MRQQTATNHDGLRHRSTTVDLLLTVWTGDADEILRVDTRTVNSVVTAMSQAVQKSIDRLVASLDQQLRPK